jgi:CRISPR system Cascade subunit CasE
VPYFSRVWLNPVRGRAQRFLGNPHTLHAALAAGISDQPVSERVLWRLDTTHRHRAELLVLTRSRPCWDHLVDQAGWANTEQGRPDIRDYQPLLDRIRAGRRFRFRVRANPVSSTKKPVAPSPAQAARLREPRPRGVRIPHRTANHQLGWFLSRFAGWGFALPATPTGPAIRLIARDRLVFTKPTASRPVVLATATVEGILRITDPDLARERLLGGVGPAKGYGCGLITLAPVTAPGPP